MSGVAVPAIWIFQVLDQFWNGGPAQVWFEISVARGFFRDDAIDSAQGVATPEIHGLSDGIGDGARGLNEFAIHVHHV